MGFVVQRLHPFIRPGVILGAARTKNAVHSQQSRWDSACAIHCLVMLLSICGLVADPSQIATRRRRLEATLWHKTAEIFQKGMTFSKLAAFIDELGCGLRTKLLERGSHREIVGFIEEELARGLLVIGSIRPVGDTQSHAVVVIGVEGFQASRQFEAHTLLILDPAEGPPAAMATCNARLHYRDGKSRRLPRYAAYSTISTAFPVVLNGAVAVGVGRPEKSP
ncbi:hypothetical protein [Paraburkholderia sp. J12]|uniref:hypothetical protein n=1 Tax=Paraburkholderia sp. J12 TaxID=2805432 RepID=UPI002ABDE116|nr:hypothetical protein [Paraburkholderia sp. J12]